MMRSLELNVEVPDDSSGHVGGASLSKRTGLTRVTYWGLHIL